MKIKIIEHREHEFVQQLRNMLGHASAMFEVNYFLGEDEDTETKSLYLDVIGKKQGSIFSTYAPLKPGEFPSDIEDGFINQTMNNILLAGLTWFNHDRIRKISEVANVGKRRGVSGHQIYLN
jgi:hypothetical protein